MTSLPEPAPTFRDQIAKIGVDYEINRRLIENNKKLKNLLKLKEVEAIPFDGTLNMKFQCSNTFDKGILYAIVEYRYVDRYDNTILKKTVKITDELANGFKNGDFEVTMRGLSITLSDFNFERRDKKVFLNDLTVDVLNIVFSDKSSIGNL